MGILPRSVFLLVFLAASTSSLSGCASRIKLALVGSSIQDVSTAAARTDDVDLVLDATPAYLLMLEGLLVSNPHNTRLLVGMAQMYVAYGSMIELDSPERAALAYARAKQHGLAGNRDVDDAQAR